MYAIPILTFLIPLAGSAAINTPPASRTEDSLTSYPTVDITNLETLIQNGPRTNLRSKGPHCLQSMGSPPLHSCMEALSLVPKDRQQVTFGQRRSKGLVDHVMPFDLISSDGLCAIRVVADVEGYNREATTHFQLVSAVDAILGACLQSQHRGGYIAGLGAGGHLRVSVTFNIDVRNVRCFDAPDMSPTETGCGDVLDTVPVSAERQIFGPKYNYGVEVVLPQVFREHKYPNPGCVIAVDPYGQQSMTASWLLVFAAANSVNAMCVRRGKEGLYVANEFGLRKVLVGLYYREPHRI